MSDSRNDAVSSQSLVRVEAVAPLGMLTLRSDLSDPKLQAAVKSAIGLGVPKPRCIDQIDAKAIAWMAPDELLILLPFDQTATCEAALSKSLKGRHFLAANVSDARSAFRISGLKWRDTLAKLTPADLSPNTFVAGEMRRTRLGQVAAAFWISGQDEVTLVCFRSVADYVFALLKNAVRPESAVEFF